jgi:uncharacterized protein (DUF362 family)/Pyruvate/2-oxoacid:ferredoxin oxidoreductase delta subunit
MGGKITIGDSSGGAIVGAAMTAAALHRSGIQQLETKGFSILNFDSLGFQEVLSPSGVVTKTIRISSAVFDHDIIINLPKLKTHVGCLYTGAIKNLYGFIPGQIKATYHILAPRFDHLSAIFVDLLELIKPQYCIMDGINALEGNGPGNSGNPRHIGVIAISRDSVGIDAVASKIIGIQNPLSIDTIRIAAERGLGEGDLEKIMIFGEPLKDLAVHDFKIPHTAPWIARTLPKYFFQWSIRFLATRPYATVGKCNRCGRCRDNCPTKAIALNDNKVLMEYKKCISCMCCLEICPEGAISLERKNSLTRKLFPYRK